MTATLMGAKIYGGWSVGWRTIRPSQEAAAHAFMVTYPQDALSFDGLAATSRSCDLAPGNCVGESVQTHRAGCLMTSPKHALIGDFVQRCDACLVWPDAFPHARFLAG